jgi:hypothetical protein
VWTRVGGPKTEDRVEQWQGTIAIAHRSRCISSFLCCTTSEHTYLYTPWRGRDLVASAMHIIASLGEGKGKRCRPKLKIAGKTLWTCGYVDGRARCFRASQHLCIPLLAQSFQASLNLIQFLRPFLLPALLSTLVAAMSTSAQSSSSTTLGVPSRVCTGYEALVYSGGYTTTLTGIDPTILTALPKLLNRPNITRSRTLRAHILSSPTPSPSPRSPTWLLTSTTNSPWTRSWGSTRDRTQKELYCSSQT